MAGKRFKDSSKWGYDVPELGYKYNMTDISASFGIDQLRNIHKWRNKRLKYVNIYSSELSSIDGIIRPKTKLRKSFLAFVYNPNKKRNVEYF